MGDRIDVEGLAVALSVEANAQLQLDDVLTRAREATACRLFWTACGMRGARNGTRPPTLPGREGGGRNGR